jgi:hypothetical protein
MPYETGPEFLAVLGFTWQKALTPLVVEGFLLFILCVLPLFDDHLFDREWRYTIELRVNYFLGYYAPQTRRR